MELIYILLILVFMDTDYFHKQANILLVPDEYAG